MFFQIASAEVACVSASGGLNREFSAAAQSKSIVIMSRNEAHCGRRSRELKRCNGYATHF